MLTKETLDFSNSIYLFYHLLFKAEKNEIVGSDAADLLVLALEKLPDLSESAVSLIRNLIEAVEYKEALIHTYIAWSHIDSEENAITRLKALGFDVS